MCVHSHSSVNLRKYHVNYLPATMTMATAMKNANDTTLATLSASTIVLLGTVGDIPPGTTRWYMGRTIRGGPARKIKACTSRLQVVLDIVIVPNWILYL